MSTNLLFVVHECTYCQTDGSGLRSERTVSFPVIKRRNSIARRMNIGLIQSGANLKRQRKIGTVELSPSPLDKLTARNHLCMLLEMA